MCRSFPRMITSLLTCTREGKWITRGQQSSALDDLEASQRLLDDGLLGRGRERPARTAASLELEMGPNRAAHQIDLVEIDHVVRAAVGGPRDADAEGPRCAGRRGHRGG